MKNKKLLFLIFAMTICVLACSKQINKLEISDDNFLFNAIGFKKQYKVETYFRAFDVGAAEIISGLTTPEPNETSPVNDIPNTMNEIMATAIDTTPEEESKMIEKAMEEGDGIGFSCASNVSEVLNEIGFNKGITPGAIEKQLKKSEKVTEIKVYKNEE